MNEKLFFEEHRTHLRAVAQRMLGSASEAEDAVQETWLRASRADATEVDNLRGWLTTIVARVCLDMLRSRKSRREDAVGMSPPEVGHESSAEDHATLADSVGLALLVVLETLDPAERLAFVLHDLFDVSFDEIAQIVGRSPAATRQLASRARRRVRGPNTIDEAELSRQREVVEAFLGALRSGDVERLVTVLDPDVVVNVTGREIHGARTWAKQAVAYRRAHGNANVVSIALVNGSVGVISTANGRLVSALRLTFEGTRIVRVDIVTERLDELEIAALDTMPA